MLTRRSIILGTAATAAVAGGGLWYVAASKPAAPGPFPVSLTEAEWRARLTEAQFAVLRDHATEPPGSSLLDKQTAEGVYHCAGCDNPVYPSETKYDSGTGWPSFWQALSPEAVGTSVDYKLIYPRTEVHCARCGGHLGHIFGDGPAPTGKRHCLNGVALNFAAA